MDAITKWLLERFFKEGFIVNAIVKILSHEVADAQLEKYGILVGNKISAQARKNMDPVNWEKVESALQNRLDTLMMNIHKGLDADDTV